jgi:hypothetical protein
MDDGAAMDTRDAEGACVVVDGANVAISHARLICGTSATTSVKVLPSLAGLVLAVQYFRVRGHRDCFAFIPAYWFDVAPGKPPFGPPEFVTQVLALLRDGWVVGTPPSESDDLWMLEYASVRSGYVCSNDMFRDHVTSREVRFGFGEGRALAAFCDERVIRYTWRGANEFLPQPLKARAAHLAPRPRTPEVVLASVQLPSGVAAVLGAAQTGGAGSRPHPYACTFTDSSPSLPAALPGYHPSAAASLDHDTLMSDETTLLPRPPIVHSEPAAAAAAGVNSSVIESDELRRVLEDIAVRASQGGDMMSQSIRCRCSEVFNRVCNHMGVASLSFSDASLVSIAAGASVNIVKSLAADLAAAMTLARVTGVAPREVPLWTPARLALLPKPAI